MVRLAGFLKVIVIVTARGSGIRLRGSFRLFFFLAKCLLPLVDGDALLKEFVERFGLWEIDQRSLDTGIETSVKQRLLGIIVQIQGCSGVLEFR